MLVGFPCVEEPAGNTRAPLQHEGGGSSEAVGPGDEAVPSLPAGDRAAHRVRALRVPRQGESLGRAELSCHKTPLGLTERL